MRRGYANVSHDAIYHSCAICEIVNDFWLVGDYGVLDNITWYDLDQLHSGIFMRYNKSCCYTSVQNTCMWLVQITSRDVHNMPVTFSATMQWHSAFCGGNIDSNPPRGQYLIVVIITLTPVIPHDYSWRLWPRWCRINVLWLNSTSYVISRQPCPLYLKTA